jgi:hypothetical protein
MSKYVEAKTQISCEDLDLLKEAIARCWEKVMGIKLGPEDLEWHEDAVPLLGFQGDVRDGTGGYEKQLGNLIIRGVGLKRANQKAKMATEWTGKSKNAHPGEHNDWAMTLGADGYFTMTITDYDPGGQQLKLSQVLLPTMAALKFEKKILGFLKRRPDGKLKINGEVVKASELSDVIMELAFSGKINEAKINFSAEDPTALRLPPKPKPKPAPKPVHGRGRRRPRGRPQQGRGREGRIREGR